MCFKTLLEGAEKQTNDESPNQDLEEDRCIRKKVWHSGCFILFNNVLIIEEADRSRSWLALSKGIGVEMSDKIQDTLVNLNFRKIMNNVSV